MCPFERTPVKVSKTFVGVCATAAMVLSGCAADDDLLEIEPLVDGCAPSGDTVQSLLVSDDRFTSPIVESQAPLEVATTERLVVVEGDGEVVENGDRVLVSYAYYNGGSGELLGHFGYEGSDLVAFPINVNSTMLEGVSYTLLCTSVGSRVVGVIPAHQAFGPEGNPQYGLEPGAPIVLVADVQAILPPPLDRVTGTIVEAPAEFPSVTYDTSGKPTVIVDTDDEPGGFSVFPVIEGSGQEVYGGAEVVVHYHGVNLNTGEVFDSSWDRGNPTEFMVSGVIPGFRDGLVGQKVGSRVLIIIPPALGYGPIGGTVDGRIGPDDTIFFVVDILGVL